MSRQIHVGGVAVGGGAPVSIQSMTNTPTHDVEATLKQIRELATAGCEIVRVAVPDERAARAIGTLKAGSPVPLVADIHFDYRLAIQAMENGADKIRINPGNIGSREKVREVVQAAKDHGIPIRVGVNSGSVEKALLEKYGGVCAEALCESAVYKTDHHRMDPGIVCGCDRDRRCCTSAAACCRQGVFPETGERSALTDFCRRCGLVCARTGSALRFLL